VPDAVRTCQEAGIVVRVVTGDSTETPSINFTILPLFLFQT